MRNHGHQHGGGAGIIVLCFFLSGATGLVYQVVWLRLLGLVFGHTVYATTTVLSAFMAGLALGSLLAARRMARLRKLIAIYGWLEIGIGACCALLPVTLDSAAPLWVGLSSALGLPYQGLLLVEFVLVFALLVIPTTLMGATLPVLSQALVGDGDGARRDVGALYAINTFGAVLGVALAGYVLLPALGNRATSMLAASGNIVAGIIALAYSRRVSRRASAPSGLEDSPRAALDAGAAGPAGGFEPVPGATLTTVALAISGAVSMLYEVGWTRALALAIGSSTYAFTSMLLAFLVGIAGGSALYSRLSPARRISPAAFALLQAGIGVATGAIILLFERAPEVFLLALRWSAAPEFVQAAQFAVSAGALLFSSLLIGATFPCAVAVVAQNRTDIGRQVGRLYGANTLGAIVGSIVAGFVLMPMLGTQATLKAGAAVNLLLASVLFAAGARGGVRWRSRWRWRWPAAAACFVGAAGVLFLPHWDQRVMSSGAAIYARWYVDASRGQDLAALLRSQQIVYYRDGLSATVAVSRAGEHVFLRVNGKLDAGTAGDMPTQLMSGHLPLLLHADPKNVLVIGLGSGITAGAVARYPIERLDVVEIEPAVVEASRFFRQLHGGVLEDPRVRTVIADGRNFLLTTRERYDVIISEPSNPWMSGLASMFSEEFFRLARERLRPGGIMLQWIQAYNIRPEDFRMVVNTFRSAFPAASIWNPVRGDFLLVGRRESSPIDLDQLRARFDGNPRVRRDLERIGVRAWPGILGFFMLGDADTARFAQGGGLNTDDKLPLEFSAPRALYLDTGETNWRLVHQFRQAPLPEVTASSRPALEHAGARSSIGHVDLTRLAYDDAQQQFQRALELDPRSLPARVGMSIVLLQKDRTEEAFRLARQVAEREPKNATALFVAGIAAGRLRKPDEALTLIRRAVALEPDNAQFQVALRHLERTAVKP
jgi:spermidine synthase